LTQSISIWSLVITIRFHLRIVKIYCLLDCQSLPLKRTMFV